MKKTARSFQTGIFSTTINVVFILILCSCSNNNFLIRNGKSETHIFVSAGADRVETYAAFELQKYLQEISGCKLPVTHVDDPDTKMIYVGFSGAPESVLSGFNIAEFGKEEYIIRTTGEDILIAGGKPRGTLYGVIGFLSDHLGCRWYTREVVKVPRKTTIVIRGIEERQKPAFEYREAWYKEAYDTQWAVHNRLNTSIVPIPDSLGGSYICYPFVHTFYQLVPPETYFSTHPEYFSMIKGVRQEHEAQLCLTNPEVVDIAVKTVFRWFEQYPEANLFSIDQNDGYGFCECNSCKALDDAEDSIFPYYEEKINNSTLFTACNTIICAKFPGSFEGTISGSTPGLLASYTMVVARKCSKQRRDYLGAGTDAPAGNTWCGTDHNGTILRERQHSLFIG